MKITNTTTRDLGLSPHFVIPAGGSLEIGDDALTVLKASPVVKSWLLDGSLVESGPVKETAAKKPQETSVKPRRQRSVKGT